MRRPALKCPHCSKLFGLLVGTSVESADMLSEPFEAICTHCGTISQFHKVAVEMVTVEGPGLIGVDE